MPSITSASSKCSAYGHSAPRPLLICLDCSEGTEVHGVVAFSVYCSTDCRGADSSHHQTTCREKNNRKRLYRAGDLLQAAFYEWREMGFDMKVTSVWNKDGFLCFFQEHTSGRDSALFRFPNELFSDPQDKYKMLAFGSCTDAQGHMFELSKRLLEGLVDVGESRELHIPVQAHHRSVYRYDSFGVDVVFPVHQVLSVDFDGQNFCVDLAGAQYSQYRAVLPAAEWQSKCTRDVSRADKHGYEAGCQESRIRETAQNKRGFLLAHAEMRLRFKAAIEYWEASSSLSVRSLLARSKKSYDEGKQMLLETIRNAFQGFVEELESGAFRLDFGSPDATSGTDTDPDDGMFDMDMLLSSFARSNMVD